MKKRDRQLLVFLASVYQPSYNYSIVNVDIARYIFRGFGTLKGKYYFANSSYEVYNKKKSFVLSISNDDKSIKVGGFWKKLWEYFEFSDRKISVLGGLVLKEWRLRGRIEFDGSVQDIDCIYSVDKIAPEEIKKFYAGFFNRAFEKFKISPAFYDLNDIEKLSVGLINWIEQGNVGLYVPPIVIEPPDEDKNKYLSVRYLICFLYNPAVPLPQKLQKEIL